MIKEIHNPADIVLNGTSKFYQIVLQLGNGSVGFWNGSGFDYIMDGFFKGKALTSLELVVQYYLAIDIANTFANQFNQDGVISISAIPSFY